MASETFRHVKALGVRGTALRLWDKFVADSDRYKPGGALISPVRPEYIPCGELPPAPGFTGSVLYLIHCFYPQRRGGTERFVLSLAKELQRRGGRARILTMSFGAPENAALFENNIYWRDYEYEGVPVTAFCYKKLPPDMFYKRIDETSPALERFFSFICERESFGLVHAAYAQPFASALKLCREWEMPYIVTATDFSLCCHAATMITPDGCICDGSREGKSCAATCNSVLVWDASARYISAKRLLEGAAHVTAPSVCAASRLEAEFPSLRIRVVPHGIGAVFFSDRPRSQVKRLIYAGNLAPLKGVGMLLDAFKALSEDVTLDIYGGSRWHELRLKRKADSRVRFHGSVAAEKMPGIFRSADCVIVPSMWQETYNFSLREALSCGCIAIVSDIGALPEVVNSGQNGFLFTAGNTGSLRDAMQKALGFDMKNYQPVQLPDLPGEFDEYERMYSNAATNQCNCSGI